MVEKRLYVQLAPTTLYRIPECYSNYKKHTSSCNLCPVKNPCRSGVIPVKKSGGDLTKREQKILELITQGLSNKMIAFNLGTSEQTVKNQVRDILLKLKAGNRAHAVAISLRYSK